ncbi:Uncharacterized protein BP5553_07247 [Venustampulla echinocandica]|uniref:Transcription factor domain-containing protein n=1 Tax=Venustampulla echinocandica TaxID=2656787 RepID=A0A370TIY9_9HELO|nr:Uncharacterized protein BP5553_07247 [Venustampulla echinocandica]RDL35316.1 Uncharacterized protein BP5553_07247 [Venustampulla echinocandica]
MWSVSGSSGEEDEALQPAYSSQGSVIVHNIAKDLRTVLQLPTDDLPFKSFHIPSRVVTSPLHFLYLTAYFRSSIPSLALHNRTFFIHRTFLSHPIPPPLQSALSTCALSTLHSPSTFSILASHLRTLIASSYTTFYSPTAILHSVQALIIFQTIRLLSSDHQHIFDAETDFLRLNKWTITLQTAYFSLPSPSTSYAEWILKESSRRTILTSVLLRSLYCTTKDGYTELVPLLGSLPVSLNGGLWEMDGEEGEWEPSWGEELGTYWEYVVRWSKGVVGGEGREKDDFERVLLCLEEDGRVGDAGSELLRSVRSGGFC